MLALPWLFHFVATELDVLGKPAFEDADSGSLAGADRSTRCAPLSFRLLRC